MKAKKLLERKHPERTEALAKALVEGIKEHRRRVHANIPALETAERNFALASLLARAIGLEAVPVREVRAAVREWTGKRALAAGKFLPNKRARGPRGELLRFWYEWHSGRSGGSLWGVMLRQYEDFCNGYDSVCQVLKYVVTGKPTQAVALWHRALHGEEVQS